MKTVFDVVIPGICGLGLHFKLDGFRLIYSCIAILMWAVSGAFSLEYMAHYVKRRRYYVFLWITFFATAGVFLSADLYTTFIFFEIMSFTSYVWVAFDEKKESLRAAETYLAVAVIGGLAMLMGLFLLYDLTGTLNMDLLGPAAREALEAGGGYLSPAVQLYAAGGLLLFGFGVKAGCFPLHIWLPKAHPVAPAPASALLSGILTKAGVFGIIVITGALFFSDGNWGLLLTALGLVTMFLGALLALLSVNLKRTLACSSISQIGFILTGIGMAVLLACVGEKNSLAVRGTLLHMVNHSLFKLVLFLCAGAVYMNLQVQPGRQAVCGFIDRYLVSAAVTVFLAVSSVVCRAMDSLVDGLILLARKTTHRQLPGTAKIRENDRLACVLGSMADEAAAWKRRWGRKEKADRTSAIPRFIEAEEELKRTGKLVEESFSFGLMLFCIGLCLTLGYLLAVFLIG